MCLCWKYYIWFGIIMCLTKSIKYTAIYWNEPKYIAILGIKVHFHIGFQSRLSYWFVDKHTLEMNIDLHEFCHVNGSWMRTMVFHFGSVERKKWRKCVCNLNPFENNGEYTWTFHLITYHHHLITRHSFYQYYIPITRLPSHFFNNDVLNHSWSTSFPLCIKKWVIF